MSCHSKHIWNSFPFIHLDSAPIYLIYVFKTLLYLNVLTQYAHIKLISCTLFMCNFKTVKLLNILPQYSLMKFFPLCILRMCPLKPFNLYRVFPHLDSGRSCAICLWVPLKRLVIQMFGHSNHPLCAFNFYVGKLSVLNSAMLSLRTNYSLKYFITPYTSGFCTKQCILKICVFKTILYLNFLTQHTLMKFIALCIVFMCTCKM